MENITAKVSCFARAYHYKNNAAHIFADDAAEALLGADYDQIAESMAQGVSFFLPGFEGTKEEGLRRIVDHQLSPSVLGRSAYCEKTLKNEMRLGCTQYLVFASGYDTFAIRNQDTPLSVYELDLPDVLSDKEERIRRAGLASCAIPVPCDLSQADWIKKLLEKGFDPAQKSFASLLGISYYLSKLEWEKLLGALAGILSKGSAICFDDPSDQESKETKANQALAMGAGEAMRAVYAYQDMEALLVKVGFLIYEHLDHAAMTQQYFSAYNACHAENPISAPRGVDYVLAVKE